MNKKGYMITPIIFITLFIIALMFTLYFSKIDAETAAGIKISATIEKGITDIYKSQNEQINFAKIAAYECSGKYCYNLTNSTNRTKIENCVNDSLNLMYGNITWGLLPTSAPSLSNVSARCYISFNLSSFSITNINMDSNREYVKTELNDNFLKKCKV